MKEIHPLPGFNLKGAWKNIVQGTPSPSLPLAPLPTPPPPTPVKARSTSVSGGGLEAFSLVTCLLDKEANDYKKGQG